MRSGGSLTLGASYLVGKVSPHEMRWNTYWHTGQCRVIDYALQLTTLEKIDP